MLELVRIFMLSFSENVSHALSVPLVICQLILQAIPKAATLMLQLLHGASFSFLALLCKFESLAQSSCLQYKQTHYSHGRANMIMRKLSQHASNYLYTYTANHTLCLL